MTMASEEPRIDTSKAEDAQMAPDQDAESATVTSPVEGQAAGRKRPRLDLTTESNRERKRGKSMFGILLGTLNKAKKEDRDRNTSEAAKKRVEIDRRLQAQLAEENDSVRRAEELKRDRHAANRKEEDLKLKETIYHNRRRRLPALAHFLLTSDTITSEEADVPSSPRPATVIPLATPPRTHPPPLFYLPAVLTPAQATFMEKRKANVKEAAEKEWQEWQTERKEEYDKVDVLRAHVEEEEARRRVDEKDKGDSNAEGGGERADREAEDVKMYDAPDAPVSNGNGEADKGRASAPPEKDKEKESGKDGDVAMAADEDDAVEY